MKGIPWHVFPTAFSSCPSALSPGTRARPKPRMPGSGSEVLLQKFSERQSDKWEVDLLRFREEIALLCGRERERRGLWLLFLYVSLSLGLSYVNWASQECCLFYLRFSLRSSDLPLFYFCGLFPCRSFSHRHSGLLFPILTT